MQEEVCSKIQWISVKDRLPEECEHVLVCGKGNLNYVMHFAYIFCGDKKWHFVNDSDQTYIETPYSDCGDTLELNSIEYWAYLPDTPNWFAEKVI